MLARPSASAPRRQSIDPPHIVTTTERPPDDAPRRAAVIEHLTALLRGDQRVVARLGKAHAPWSGLGVEALAEALVDVSSNALADAFLMVLRAANPPGSTETRTLSELFEHALPYVVTHERALWQDENGRWHTSVSWPQTLEPHMAWTRSPDSRTPKVAMTAPEQRGEYPIPRYYVPVDIPELPETGAVLCERVDVVERDVSLRDSVQQIGTDWHRREGGAAVFGALPPRRQETLLKSAVRATERGEVYGIVNAPNEATQRYIDALHHRLPILRVIEAWPTDDNADADFDLFSQIRELYKFFHAAKQ
jgi:hypothetical protein